MSESVFDERKMASEAFRAEIVSMKKEDIDEIKIIEQENGLSVWTREAYAEETERRDSIALVVKIEKQVIGFVIARLIMNQQFDSQFSGVGYENELEIYNITVKKSFQNKGIGHFLLKTLVQMAVEENGVGKIWLEVRESNANAVKLYKKSGFSEDYIRKNFYNSPTENAIVMSLDTRSGQNFGKVET